MPPISERFDIVYAWSAIHYVAHSLELLARFVEYRPRAILLVNHPVSRDHGFVRGQRSDGYFCPAHVLSLGEVEDALPGYRLAFRGSDDFEFNVDNFPPAYRVADAPICCSCRRDRERLPDCTKLLTRDQAR